MPARLPAPCALALAAALLTLAGPARAAITPEAQAIVDHYVLATGGAAVLATEHALHSKGRLRDLGLSGTLEQWSEVPDHLLTRVQLGTVRLRSGYDGSSAWVTDLNSKRVRVLEGHELDRVRSEAYFENEMWARPGQGGGSVKSGASSYRGDEVWQSLEVTPPAGPSRRLWFGSKSGLLLRVDTRGEQDESEVFLSAWRTTQGRKHAMAQGPSPEQLALMGPDGGTSGLTMDSLDVNPTLDGAFFSPPESQEGEVEWMKAHGVAQLPFRYGSRHVWIKVSINGAPPMDFLLDTGCSVTAIDRDYAVKIGLIQQGEFSVQGMGGAGEASFARVESIRLDGEKGDGVSLHGFNVGILDLGEQHEVLLWRKLGGLIGYDFLSHFAVEIDYDTQVVTLHDPKTYVHSGAGTVLAMKLHGGIPMVPMRLDDRCEGQFIVDVGNSFGLIVHGSLVRPCGYLRDGAHRKELEVYGGGVGDGFVSWLSRLDSLSLGTLRVRQPIAGLSLASHGMVGSEEVAGNIGNAVLERFRCTFDYAHGRLYLDPGRRYDQSDRYSRAGVMLLRYTYRVVVAEVVHGSPADEAGLKPHDEVEAIDGKPALGYTLEQIDAMLTNGDVGAVHSLTVSRDGKRSQLTLTLADVI
jgi:Aspartyl protease/PDZ domain